METKHLYASVTEDVHRTVKARAARDGRDLTGWVHDAVMEKLDRPGAVQNARFGPLADLLERDRRAALRYIRFLKVSPEEFKDSLDGILKTIASLERRVCRRK